MMLRMAAMVCSASQWELHLTWHRNGELTSMHLLCTERIWEGFEENAIGVVMSVLLYRRRLACPHDTAYTPWRLKGALS